jgi:hypothetical protein
VMGVVMSMLFGAGLVDALDHQDMVETDSYVVERSCWVAKDNGEIAGLAADRAWFGVQRMGRSDGTAGRVETVTD